MRLIIKKLKSQSGFTLIEILITLALMAVVSVPIAASLILGLRIYDAEVEVDRTFQNQQDVFMMIKNEVRQNPSQVDVVQLSGGDYAIEIGQSSKLIRYYMSQSKIYKQTATQTIEILTDVKSFKLNNLVRNSNNTLKSFTLEMVSSFNDRDQILTADFALDRY